MPFNVLLLPLLGGFIFISRWNRTRWYTKRAEKERLLLYASLAGLFWLTIAFIVVHIPPPIPCREGVWCFPTWWAQHNPFPHTGLSLVAFTLAAVMWKPLNLLPCFDEIKEGDRIIEREGSELERLLDRAMRHRKPVMITLKGGKVYVGRVVSTYPPGEPDKAIHLVPTKSGYREGDKQRVEFTTDYDVVYASIKDDYPDTYEEIIKEFGVVILTDQILSITLYNYEVHANYFTHKDPPR